MSYPPSAAAQLAERQQQLPSLFQQYAQAQQIENQKTQQQTAQLQQTGLQQENQIRASQIRDTETLRSLGPKHVQKDADGNVTGFDTNGLLQEAAGKGVNPQILNKMRLDYAEAVQKSAAAGTAQIELHDKQNDQAYQILEGVRAIKDPTTREAAYQKAIPQIKNLGVAADGLPATSDDTALQGFEAHLGVHKQVLADAKTASETNKANEQANLAKMEAAEKGSPLTKMENDPTMFAGDKLPASMAYLQSKVKDSDTAVVARATRLLSTAQTAQQNQLAMERSKKASDQAITQGSPAVAAKLLVDGDATLSQMKARGVTPEFIQQTLLEAKKLDSNWNAQKAEADFDVAKSPAQVAFFGSAKSLTDRGGTLDQLMAAAKDIPGGKIPVFNSVADALAAATGSGPIAKYASIALGVADDYSKVMGGGQGSDTSRTQALNLIAKNLSPEGRLGSVEGIRGSVESQKNSRIGGNPVLQKMYGGDGGGAKAKTLSMAQVQQAAKDHGVSVDEAKKQAQAAGYTVQ